MDSLQTGPLGPLPRPCSGRGQAARSVRLSSIRQPPSPVSSLSGDQATRPGRGRSWRVAQRGRGWSGRSLVRRFRSPVGPAELSYIRLGLCQLGPARSAAAAPGQVLRQVDRCPRPSSGLSRPARRPWKPSGRLPGAGPLARPRLRNARAGLGGRQVQRQGRGGMSIAAFPASTQPGRPGRFTAPLRPGRGLTPRPNLMHGIRTESGGNQRKQGHFSAFQLSC